MSTWSVYLSGEIHTDWRERIEQGAKEQGLPVTFSAPVTNHAASDDCGVDILGEEDQAFWKDHKGAGSTLSHANAYRALRCRRGPFWRQVQTVECSV